jgi:hypothetical protein
MLPVGDSGDTGHVGDMVKPDAAAEEHDGDPGRRGAERAADSYRIAARAEDRFFCAFEAGR